MHIESIIKKVCNQEAGSYLIFGVLATLLNWVLFYLFASVMKMSTFVANGIDIIICILFQYMTNRIWVFKSRTRGKVALAEFVQFISARAITALIDQILVVVGVDYFVRNFISQHLKGIATMAVKVFSGVVVVVLNYIFSKLFVFKKEK